MKGLLLKDWYIFKKYCKWAVFIFIFHVGLSFVSPRYSTVFYIWPCLLCGVLPSTLLELDENNKWHIYSCTLPYSKAQIVSAKYLIGLASQLITAALAVITQVIEITFGRSSIALYNLELIAALVMLSSVTTSITLALIFKFGTKKGRIACMIVIALSVGSVGRVLDEVTRVRIHSNTRLILICITTVVVYALSWLLSIRFYSKREMT